jgi:hypothetical protein
VCERLFHPSSSEPYGGLLTSTLFQSPCPFVVADDDSCRRAAAAAAAAAAAYLPGLEPESAFQADCASLLFYRVITTGGDRFLSSARPEERVAPTDRRRRSRPRNSGPSRSCASSVGRARSLAQPTTIVHRSRGRGRRRACSRAQNFARTPPSVRAGPAATFWFACDRQPLPPLPSREQGAPLWLEAVAVALATSGANEQPCPPHLATAAAAARRVLQRAPPASARALVPD